MFSSTILQCIKLEITKNTFFLPVLIQHHQQQGNRERKREKEKKGLSLTRELGNTKRQMRGSSSYYRLWTRNRLFFLKYLFFISLVSFSLPLVLSVSVSFSHGLSFLPRCLFPLTWREFLVFGDVEGRSLVASSSSSWILNFLGSCSSSDQAKETREVHRGTERNGMDKKKWGKKARDKRADRKVWLIGPGVWEEC